MVRFVLRIVLCEVFYGMTIKRDCGWLDMTECENNHADWWMYLLLCWGHACSGSAARVAAALRLGPVTNPLHRFSASSPLGQPHPTPSRSVIRLVSDALFLGFGASQADNRWLVGSSLDHQKSMDKACCKDSMSSWWLFDLALGGTSRGGCRLHCWSSPLPLMHNLVFSLQSHCCATL